jgi:hypothetical protein
LNYSYASRRRYHAIIHQLCLFREPKITVWVHSTPEHRYQHAYTKIQPTRISASRSRDDRARHCNLTRQRAAYQRVQLEEQAITKPKIMGWLESGRENGPATRTHSTRSAVCKGSRSVVLLWRTCEEGRDAEPKMRLLVVVAVELHIVSCAPVRLCSEFGLCTRIERLSMSEMLMVWIQGLWAQNEGARRASRSYYDERRPAKWVRRL